MQWNDAVSALTAAMPGIKIDMFGGVCPFQADGILPDGQQFYLRYRHDAAQLYIAPADGDIFDDTTEYASIDEVTGDCDRGDLSAQEAIDLFVRLYSMRTRRAGQKTYNDILNEQVEAIHRWLDQASQIHREDLELTD